LTASSPREIRRSISLYGIPLLARNANDCVMASQ
jgi:hypothetical protein